MVDDRFVVRDATDDDAAACAAIYAPYVADTAITFEEVPPTPAEMLDRIRAARRAHAWLVLDDGERIVGYAYAGTFNPRAAYRWSCEVSIYLEMGRRRGGGGRALYAALLARMSALGYRTALAGMTVPNEASAGLHRAFGFEAVGTYRGVGWKHGRWRDVTWLQRSIAEGDREGVLQAASDAERSGARRL